MHMYMYMYMYMYVYVYVYIYGERQRDRETERQRKRPLRKPKCPHDPPLQAPVLDCKHACVCIYMQRERSERNRLIGSGMLLVDTVM